MNIAFFSTTKTDRKLFLPLAKKKGIDINFLDVQLNEQSVFLAKDADGICVFVNDKVTPEIVKHLATLKIKLIILRCAGFNNVNLKLTTQYDITVLRVPSYSPMAVAEHALALMMSLNRKTYRAYNRVRDNNFSLEGLLGFDMFNKTIGIIGTGKIGIEMIKISKGLGMNILAHDISPNQDAIEMNTKYVSLNKIYEQADIISLHLPLLPETKYMINTKSISKMTKGVMLINTSRGGLIDTKALITALKSEQIGYLGIDVYEEEGCLFFEDHSEEIIQDDVFERLLTFPNVLITAHQAFFTKEALTHIAETSLQNILDFKNNQINNDNLVTLCK